MFADTIGNTFLFRARQSGIEQTALPQASTNTKNNKQWRMLRYFGFFDSSALAFVQENKTSPY